jgi:hypothetical protein
MGRSLAVDCTDEDMLHHASLVDSFFSAYPNSVIHCLTSLSLDNVCFAKWDMHHFLFDCCKQLRCLYLSNCAQYGRYKRQTRILLCWNLPPAVWGNLRCYTFQI